MRLIDADALLEKVLNIPPYCGHCDGYGFVQLDCVQDAVEYAPTIEAEFVKHGRWRLNRDGSGTCSNCRRTQLNVWDFDNYDNYCAHCGADMRGPEMEGEG